MMTSLQQTEEYFSDLQVLLANCERQVIDDVDEEILEDLKDKRSELDRHGRRLKSAADELEWTSDEEREEYIGEIDEAVETLDTGLSQINVKEGVPQDMANDLREAARILNEDTAGLMEDL